MVPRLQGTHDMQKNLKHYRACHAVDARAGPKHHLDSSSTSLGTLTISPTQCLKILINRHLQHPYSRAKSQRMNEANKHKLSKL